MERKDPSFDTGADPERHRKAVIQSAFARDEDYLYRNLSDPHRWPLQSELILASFGDVVRRRTAEELRQQRRDERGHKIHQHQLAAEELIIWADRETDPERRTRLLGAAQVNEALAQALEALAAEAFVDEPTAQEKRVAREEQLDELVREHEYLVVRRRRAWLTRTRTDLDERLLLVAQRMQILRQQIDELKMEESATTEQTRRQWAALEEAKRMVAESDERARFNQLAPDIPTRLCTQWRACEQIRHYQDETALTMAIGDVLMTLGATVPVATLSVLVVKIGVKKFCNCPA